jgi:uncharacterized membrane protein YbaN (DUF454 family)
MSTFSTKAVTVSYTIVGLFLILIGIIGLILPVMPGFIFLIPGIYLMTRVWKRVFPKAPRGEMT